MKLNKIYNADCFAEDGLQSIPSKSIHLTITDPPYLHNKGGGKTHGTEGKSSIANSQMYNFNSPMMKKMSSFGDNEIIKLLDEIKRVMIKMNCYIFCNDTQIPYYLNWAIVNKYKYTILTWEKPLSILNRNRFSQNLEYVVRIYESGTGLNPLDIDKYPEKKEYYSKNRKMNPLRGKEKIHPLQKPEEYIKGLIELSSNECDIILDPFSGSGQVPFVAMKLNRNFIGFELEEKYYKIAQERICSYQNDIESINDNCKTS